MAAQHHRHSCPHCVRPSLLSRLLADWLWRCFVRLVTPTGLYRPSLKRSPILNRERSVVNIADHMRRGLENDLASCDRLDRSVDNHLIG
jgi:hypothetical protein